MNMKKIMLFKFAFFLSLSLWIAAGNAQEKEDRSSLYGIKKRNIEVFKYTNSSDMDVVNTVKLAGMNMVPYQLPGWDDKIVVSTVTGTNTSSSIIYDNQRIYLDLAVANYGSTDITQSFSSKLYIDGTLSKSISGTGLESETYLSISDLDIGILPAGSHTLKYVVDANNEINETDESDNEYSRTITITEDITGVCSNLTPCQHMGWDDKIVLSTIMETNLSDSDFYDNEIIYLDWASINNGNCDISKSFSTKVYVDNVEVSTLEVSGLSAGFILSRPDIAIGPLNAGQHTFRIVVDANKEISETNENDNEYTRIITVDNAVCVNISPYMPTVWDDKIVLSTVVETNISAPAIYDNQNIYLDWAFENNGTCDIPDTVFTRIYVDDELIITYYTPGLLSGYYIYMYDLNLGTLPPGVHTFRIVTDAKNDVIEFNENDNEYTRTFTVSASPTGFEPIENAPGIKIYPNPVSDEMVIEFKENKQRLNFEIFNSMGQVIYSSNLIEKTIVQTSNLIPGYYLIKFNNEKFSGTKKIIKE
jgi:hypothetical protein